MGRHGELHIMTGTANPELAEQICEHLGCRITPVMAETFSDGEIRIEIQANVRGADVFVVQPTCAPVNFHLMQLCLMLDALKRASASRVTAIVPYYGYARQDRKVTPRTPISAKLVADLISASGMDRLLTVDLHAGQIQGFFDQPVDNLYAAPVLLSHLNEIKDPDTEYAIVSPDAGGVERARAYAKRLEASLAIIDKRRDVPNKAQAMNLIGSVEGKVAVVLDDMIDTAGTICSAGDVLMDNGAKACMACCTHPVLSGPAIERLEKSAYSKVVVTDTIPLRPKARECGKIKALSVAGLLAKAIHNIHTESSVSVLFV
jgi:ribose-phosphate pyrophosphokinase